MPEIKNLKKVANRILKAIKDKEKIILYGDADLDGVTSVILLRESIQNLGWKVSAIYFPDREEEGYGINKKALENLKKFSPALLIALDCGISNFEEIILAKNLGFEVVIIDHHVVLNKLPSASIIVDPKQKGDKYPFKEFATAGIVFKLVRALLKRKLSEPLRRNFLEMVSVATLADMMPRVEDNKIFIDEGLKFLKTSWRPGIKAFFDKEVLKSFGDKFSSIDKNYNNLEEIIYKIISLSNIRDIKKNSPAGFRLLTSSSLAEAKRIIAQLVEKNIQRKQKIGEILQEVEDRVSSSPQGPIIFEGDSSWELLLISPVASIICQRYKKPTFLFKKMKEESQGTVRMPSGMDGVKGLLNCSHLLKNFGGHPTAAGFRIKNDNLGKLGECLSKYFQP